MNKIDGITLTYLDDEGVSRSFEGTFQAHDEPPIEEPAPVLKPVEPEPSFEFYGHVEGRHEEAIKYRSGIYSPLDSLIGCAGYDSYDYLTIDPFEKTVDTSTPTSKYGFTRQNWVDGTTLPDGNRLFFSHTGKGPLIHDPTTGDFSTLSGPSQCRSGHVDKNGIIYFVQFSGKGPLRTIYRYDYPNKTWITPIYYETDREDEIFKTHPDWKKWNTSGAYDSQWGMTPSGDGRYLYTSQFAAGRPIRIDTVEGVAEQWGEFNACGLIPPEPLTSWKQLHWSGYWAKMSGGVQSSVTGEAVIFPRAGNVVQIHGGPGGSREVELPEAVLNDHKTRSFGNVEGPGGWIFNILWHSDILFAFHPLTDEFRTWDVSHLKAEMGAPRGTHTYAKGVFIQELNCIDFIPARADKVWRVSFPASS